MATIDMPLSRSDAALVEEWASKYARYSDVSHAQATELRKQPERLRVAYKAVVNQWRFQSVTVGQRAEYMARMEDNCLKVPQSFADRIEILFSANCVLHAIECWTIPAQSNRVQVQYDKRKNELLEQLRIQWEIPPQARNISPSVPTHPLDSSEVDEFQRNPSSLLGKEFVHLVAVGDDEARRAYAVVEFGRGEEVGWWFRICYEDTRELERLEPGGNG
ncbi:hypothetical protein BS47DRAFT_1382786 [Hydnum rufescens UP504]|uniref:Uncharacterized protein n=1 Tax=Hydnum rufescens UP504 TaxID=1448309 RepID=A0A9P6DVK0_9AGAM|nr:hypothetical protein BS47DRAFT_1382786 [Hydnum rufescens UP504]